MTLRTDWKFHYGQPALLRAAKSKVLHHVGRLAFWNEEKGKAEKTLREKGVELREQPGSSGYVGIQHVLDPQLQARYGECCGKVREHERQRDEYDRWHRALERTSDSTNFDLDVEDVAFFGL